MLVRHFLEPVRRPVANDVEEQVRDVHLHERKDGVDKTFGGIDVGGMCKVSDKKQTQRFVAMRVTWQFRERCPEWDTCNGGMLIILCERLSVALSEYDNRLDLPDDCPFKPFPSKHIKVAYRSRQALPGPPQVAGCACSWFSLNEEARGRASIKGRQVLSHYMIVDLHNIGLPESG